MRPHSARPILAWLCVLALLLTGLARARGLVLCVAPGGHVAIDVVMPGERCAGDCRSGSDQDAQPEHVGDAPTLAGECCVDIPIHWDVTLTPAPMVHPGQPLASPALLAWCLVHPPLPSRTPCVPPPKGPPDLSLPVDLVGSVVLIL